MVLIALAAPLVVQTQRATGHPRRQSQPNALEIRGDMRQQPRSVPGKSDYAIFLHPSDGASQTSSVGKSDDYHFDTHLPSPQLIRGDAGRLAGWG